MGVGLVKVKSGAKMNSDRLIRGAGALEGALVQNTQGIGSDKHGEVQVRAAVVRKAGSRSFEKRVQQSDEGKRLVVHLLSSLPDPTHQKKRLLILISISPLSFVGGHESEHGLQNTSMTLGIMF